MTSSGKQPVTDRLYMQTTGKGEPLVMLHGWGFHSGVWGHFAERLSESFRLTLVDLPGHGRSSMVCPLQLDSVVGQILSRITEPVHWLGWSLGASIVMRLASIAPQQVRSMSLLAASPCFVQTGSWRSGIKADILERFEHSLETDYRKTLMKFIALQTLSANDAKMVLTDLREKLFQSGPPDKLALQQGLDILANADLRAEMTASKNSCLVVLGERDQLVPSSVSEFYRGLSCKPRVEIINGAGHVPFISHLEKTTEMVRKFHDCPVNM